MNVPVEVVEAAQEGRCVLFVGPEATRELALEGVPVRRRKRARLPDPSTLTPGAFHTTAVRRFSTIFSTCADDLLERAAADLDPEITGPSEPVPALKPDTLQIHRLIGPSHPTVDLTGQKKPVRAVLRKNVALFVGYRLDDEHFEQLFQALSDAYGGELPRVHLAVAQDGISDYHWQKWVWRGLLLFIADPSEALATLEAQRDD